MSNMVPGLFDENEQPVALEQVVFDYRLLSAEKREFVLQKTDETQILLKRTAENIIKIGNNLQSVKSMLPHGMYLPWLKSEFGMSRQSADRFTHVAEQFDGKLPKLGNLQVSALYLLAESTPEARGEAIQRAESGEKITHALARQIIDAQESLKKAQEAETNAQAEREVAQQQLFQIQSESTKTIGSLSAQIATLREEMRSLETPPVEFRDVVKNVTPPDVEKKLKYLQEQVERLQAERTSQESRIEKLNGDINTAIRTREFAENADRLRQAWRLVTGEAHTCLMRLLGQWPTPLDVQSFDADDWARLDHLKTTLQRTLKECEGLQYHGNEAIIESNGYSRALSVHGTVNEGM